VDTAAIVAEATRDSHNNVTMRPRLSSISMLHARNITTRRSVRIRVAAATAAAVGVNIHRLETAAAMVEARGILPEAIRAADLGNNFFPQPLRPPDRAGAAFFWDKWYKYTSLTESDRLGGGA